MDSFTLKMIAMIAMLIDHAGKTFFRSAWWMECIGRLAFPIFAYQAAVGYRRTSDLEKYIKRLIVFACVSQIPYSLFMMILGVDELRLNIGFTLLLGVVALLIHDKIEKWWRIPLILLICILAEVIGIDYGVYGVAMVILSSWLERIMHDEVRKKTNMESRWRLMTQAAVMVLCYALMTVTKYATYVIEYPKYGWLYGWQMIWVMLGLILILMHNGKRGWNGKGAKYLFYVFYPVHLLVIYIIYMVLW